MVIDQNALLNLKKVWKPSLPPVAMSIRKITAWPALNRKPMP